MLAKVEGTPRPGDILVQRKPPTTGRGGRQVPAGAFQGHWGIYTGMSSKGPQGFQMGSHGVQELTWGPQGDPGLARRYGTTVEYFRPGSRRAR